MQIQEINSAKLEDAFYQLPYKIYANNKEWIAPLENDVKAVFNVKANPFYSDTNCKRWILYDDEKNSIGRIAAFVNSEYKNKGDDYKVGGFGFFECIHDQRAANFLLDTAKHFLKNLYCEAMDGPINFGERDKFWGLLIEGFQSPLYGMNYHPPYYKKLLENYGLQIFYEQICFEFNLKTWQPNMIMSIYNRLQKNNNYEIKTFNKNQLKQFAADFTSIYNAAWLAHEGNKKMNIEKTVALFKSLKLFIDEEIILFVYKAENPIAFFLNLPELNFYFKNINGKLKALKKLQIIFTRLFKKNKKAVGIVYGVIPEYQKKGIDALLVMAALERLKNLSYEKFEIQWIGTFNEKMISFVSRLQPQVSRKLATYRIFFNPHLSFKKHPKI